MFIYEDMDPLLWIGGRFHALIRQVSASMDTTLCGVEADGGCRDDVAALRLKLVAIAAILVAAAAGVAIPLVMRMTGRALRGDGNWFVLAKAFAGGVILATGFVHMLPDAEEALGDPCVPESPWGAFPFVGFTAMTAALVTLLVDFVGTQLYERKERYSKARGDEEEPGEAVAVDGEAEEEAMHIVGIHAHAAAHRHSHPHGPAACDGSVRRGDVHSRGEEESSHVRHVVVSQILEFGIVSHSVIIGLSLGVSQSPCTIRPLVGALSFHQFFEGFALGGCISQAQFRNLHAILMACFFAITTPAGIGVGASIASSYNANSPRALVVEGLLDSVSAGILIYMALVDLIAVDFLSRRMSCNIRLQTASFVALFVGAWSMSALAIWA